MAEGEQQNMRIGYALILQIVCIIAGLGVGYGALKGEVDTLKAAQTVQVVRQNEILDKLTTIEIKLAAIENSVAERKRDRR